MDSNTSVRRRFAQIDVFTSGPFTGNPVAVVVDGDGLTPAQMQRFAHWTNLSETTFICPPTEPTADYLLRIFTPAAELPFAGHPTLGSAAAWLASGAKPKGDNIIQQCGIGLVEIAGSYSSAEGSGNGVMLAFAAPPLRRSGPVDASSLQRAVGSLGIRESAVRAAAWVDNGPGWLGLLLDSAELVRGIRPDFAAMGELKVGIIGRDAAATHDAGDLPQYEVRAFCPGFGVNEDPVTGSLNAGLAVWLREARIEPGDYLVTQGTAVRRAGRVHVRRDGPTTWVGGTSAIAVEGTVAL